jgi:hypothetical protein
MRVFKIVLTAFMDLRRERVQEHIFWQAKPTRGGESSWKAWQIQVL